MNHRGSAALIISFIVAVVVIIGAGGWWYYQSHKSPSLSGAAAVVPNEQVATSTSASTSWQEVNVQSLGFKADFPGSPQQTMINKPSNGPFATALLNLYLATDVMGSAYSVGTIAYPATIDVSNPKANLGGALNTLISGNNGSVLISSTTSNFENYPSLDYLIQDDVFAPGTTVYLKGRIILIGHIIYQQQVIYKSQDYDENSYNKFINSLVLASSSPGIWFEDSPPVTIQTITKTFSPGEVGSLTFSDGSAVTIPAGLIARTENVSASLLSWLPAQSPNQMFAGVGRSISLSFSDPIKDAFTKSAFTPIINGGQGFKATTSTTIQFVINEKENFRGLSGAFPVAMVNNIPALEASGLSGSYSSTTKEATIGLSSHLLANMTSAVITATTINMVTVSMENTFTAQ